MKTRLLIFLTVILALSSCSVPKYTYYYYSTKTTEGSTPPEKRLRVGSGLNYEYQIDKDTNQIDVLVMGSKIDYSLQNSIPIYIDYGNSRIVINDSVYSINSEKKDSIIFFKPQKSYNIYKWHTIGEVEIPKLLNTYKYYTDNQYETKKITYHPDSSSTKEKEIQVMEFNKENSPLKISVSIVYCKDKDCMDKQTILLDLYQSDLAKAKNVRDCDNRENEVYDEWSDIRSELHATYHKKEKTGRIWGWPELRYGLSTTLAWTFLPITWPINMVIVLVDGESARPLQFPFFE